jgi:hypothetical protein
MTKPAANSESREKLVINDGLLAIVEWLTGDDTGVSSKYMAAVAIFGRVTKSRRGDSTPQDASDLGRCVRLIAKVPCVFDTLSVLRDASPVWAAYVDHWEELTTLWHQGCYRATTNRMVTLRLTAQALLPAPTPGANCSASSKL